MTTLDPQSLLDRFAALPAAAPVRAALAATPDDVYLVGGAVRDLARGRTPAELDFVVEQDPAGLAAALAGGDGVAIRAFHRFGTATVTRDGFVYDLAWARAEAYEHPGALPSVAAADLATDLRRRDFTVNAIALAVAGPARGRLVAAPRAPADLEAGVLRVLHAGSFRDDPTRLLRLARYAGRLGFAVEPATRALAAEAAAHDALATVSGNRIGAELRLLAREADPVGALSALATLGLDRALAPAFGLTDPDTAARALALLPDDGNRAVLVLAAAAQAMSGPEREALLERLAFPAPERDAIRAAASRAPALAVALDRARAPSQIAAAVGPAGPEVVALAGAQAGGAGAQAARAWLAELRTIGLEITGGDLLAAGVAPGVAVGVGLRAALAARLDGRARGRTAELAEALRAALA